MRRVPGKDSVAELVLWRLPSLIYVPAPLEVAALSVLRRGYFIVFVPMRVVMRLVLVIAVFYGLVLLTDKTQAQNRLESARQEISQKQESKSSSCSATENDSSDDDNNSFIGGVLSGLISSASVSDDESSSGATELSGSLIFGVLSAPWSIPRQALSDVDGEGYFGDYPFSDDWDGFIVDELPQPEWTRQWAGRFTSEYGDNFGGLSKVGGRLQLESTSRFGIDIEWDRRREELFAGHDTLWTGDANIVYRFAQNRYAAFYTGLGANWSADNQRSSAGFNFTYGADFFPARNWVISSTLDIGRLGHATLFHGRATVGVIFNRFEIFTGYDHYKLGGVELNGLVSGLRLWF